MTYAELLAAAKAYADRYNDTELNAVIDHMLVFAEARINRKMRVRDMTARTITTTVADTEYYSLPSDFAGLRDIQISGDSGSGNRRTLKYRNPEQMNELHNTNRNNAISDEYENIYYCIIADQIQITPKQDAGLDFELVYYQKVPALTSSNTTNWMSLSHPDIYMASIMEEIELFVKNTELALTWDKKLDRSLDELIVSDAVDRWSGTPLTIQSETNGD